MTCIPAYPDGHSWRWPPAPPPRHRVRAPQAQSTLERAKADGYIRVGFANEAPFGYATPDGKLTGKSPEVVKAVLAKMGIDQVDGVLTEFGSLIPGLQAGRFDIIAAGMFVNPKRCEQVQFSEPTYGIGQAFLVQAGNPKGWSTTARSPANPDLKLAVMAGAVEAGYAKDAGVAQEQLIILPDQSSLVKAVQGGPRRRRRADRALDRRHGVEERRRGIDEAVRRGRGQIGGRPRRRWFPQGRQGPLRGIQCGAEEVHRQRGAYRAGDADRIRQGLSCRPRPPPSSAPAE